MLDKMIDQSIKYLTPQFYYNVGDYVFCRFFSNEGIYTEIFGIITKNIRNDYYVVEFKQGTATKYLSIPFENVRVASRC